MVRQMDLNQIRYVLALCDEQNFTRAAKRCGVAQPSLTNGVRRLEAELGGPLFLRRPAVRLSPLGKALRPHFEHIMREIVAVEAKAARLCRTPATRRGQTGAASRSPIAP